MCNMEMVERFREAFEYLYNIGAIHTKKDLAEKMKVSRGSVQNAYAGNESYMNDSFMKKLARTFPGVLNLEWLLYGTGEMLQRSQKPQEAHVISEVNNSTPETLSELVGQITRLLNKIDEKDAKIEELMKENNELREELNGGYLSKKRS